MTAGSNKGGRPPAGTRGSRTRYILHIRVSDDEWNELFVHAERAETSLSDLSRERIFAMRSTTWTRLESRARKHRTTIEALVRAWLEG